MLIALFKLPIVVEPLFDAVLIDAPPIEVIPPLNVAAPETVSR
jgi:hypothetical protein